MSEMALALFVLCAAACAPSSSSVTPPSQQAGRDIAPYTITPAPTTIQVELDDSSRDALASQLAARSLGVARLILREVRPTGAQTLKGIRIFVEKPDADLSTPIEDPHYAGSFVLGFTPSETINLNIAPALRKMWASRTLTRAALTERKGIRVTFVPEPWEPARRMPPEFSLTIQAAALDVPRS
jgi:hypothetical protein